MAEHKQSASGTLPKNIRQIGTSTGSTRVYLEDYVYTYLHTQEEQEEWAHRGFVLLGRIERGKDYTRYFISGLIRLEDGFFKDNILEFCDETWAHIYKEMKQYYDDLEIVGWGQDISCASASLTAELESSHKQNFNIQKNVLFLLDQIEKEEAFYIFEKNVLQRREGYYVYYEKNPQMQEYMIESKKSRELDISPEEIQEPLVHSYREALNEKKAQLAARKWNGVLYATSMLLVLSVCVLGVSTVNNVEKMQNLESTVSQISSQGGQASGVPAMSQNTQQGDFGNSEDDGQGGDSDGSGKNAQGNSKGADSDGSGSSEQGTGGGSGKDAQGTGGGSGQSTQGAGNGSGQAAQGADGDSGSGTQGTDSSSGQDAQGADGSSSQETAALTEAQTYLLQGYYIVKKGDSLVGISSKIYGTPKKAEKICELNGIEDMDKIYAGQKLRLP